MLTGRRVLPEFLQKLWMYTADATADAKSANSPTDDEGSDERPNGTSHSDTHEHTTTSSSFPSAASHSNPHTFSNK